MIFHRKSVDLKSAPVNPKFQPTSRFDNFDRFIAKIRPLSLDHHLIVKLWKKHLFSGIPQIFGSPFLRCLSYHLLQPMIIAINWGILHVWKAKHIIGLPWLAYISHENLPTIVGFRALNYWGRSAFGHRCVHQHLPSHSAWSPHKMLAIISTLWWTNITMENHHF